MDKVHQTPLIGTHSGVFHCDEALAVFLLRLLPAYQNASLVRTRDLKTLDTCNIVVDVGGVYDHVKCRYDHHQKGFEENFGQGYVTKLSSAGLVYKCVVNLCLGLPSFNFNRLFPFRHYGIAIIATVLSLPESHPTVTTLYPKLYGNFIEAIDGKDNGIPSHSGPGRYSVNTHLSVRVRMLNPNWNEESNDAIRDAKFLVASKLAGEEFLAALSNLANVWLPAREIVWNAVEKRKETHSSGMILILERSALWEVRFFFRRSKCCLP